MPSRAKWVTEWERALLSVRSNKVGPVSLSESAQAFLAEAYADMLLQIEATILRKGTELGPLTAQVSLARIRSIMDIAGRDVSEDLRRRIDRLIESITEDHERAARAAFDVSNLTGAFAADFASVPQRALEGMAKRAVGEGISGNFRSIIATQWGHTFAEVDRFLIAQVGLGAPAEVVKRRLAFMLATDSLGNIDPALARALKTRGVAGRRFLGIINRAKANPELLGYSSASQAVAALEAARGLLWKSRRIAVSEINTAHSEAHREGAITSPVVDLFKWNVSGRHRGLPSSPDVCDTLATRDVYGLGAGVYFPENYPYRPHPNCACFQSFILRPIDQWDKPKRKPTRPRRITPAEIMEDYGDRIGEKRAKNLAGRLNSQVKSADEAYRRGLPPKPAGGSPGPAAPGFNSPGITPAPGTPGRFAHNPLRNPISGEWLPGDQAFDIIKDRIERASGEALVEFKKAQADVERITKEYVELFTREATLNTEFKRLEADLYRAMDKTGIHNPGSFKFLPNAHEIIKARYRENPRYVELFDELARITAERERLEDVQKLLKDDLIIFKDRFNKAASDSIRPLLLHELDEIADRKFEISMFNSESIARDVLGGDFLGDYTIKQVESGLQTWARMIGPKWLAIPERKINLFSQIVLRAFHAEVNVGGVKSTIIGVGRYRTEANIIHEMGHWLEGKVDEFNRKVVLYLKTRTAGRPVRMLSDLTGIDSYSSREIAWDMKGSSDLIPYVWRNYGDGLEGTELTSTFVEYMLTKPSEMMSDRDFWVFMYNLLRGYI